MAKTKSLNEMFESLNGIKLKENLPDTSFEYSIDEFKESFMKILTTFPFSGNDYFKSPNITIPESRNSSAVVFSKENGIEKWTKFERMFGQENPNIYIWDIEPKTLGIKKVGQRYDLNGVLTAVESGQLKKIQISFNSQNAQKASKEMGAGEHGSLDEYQDNNLNAASVKEFLSNVTGEFERNHIEHNFDNVKIWAFKKIEENDLFNTFTLQEKVRLGGNLVLFLLKKPSPFDKFMA